MPKAPSTALVGAGPVSQSWVARLPGLRRNLTLVKSSSTRIASRIANAIRCGRPVDSYEALRRSDLVLIGVPDEQLDFILEEMLASGVDWSACSLVLCSRRNDSRALTPFRDKGASTASLDVADGFDEKRYLFEGNHLALSRLRRLVEEEGLARIIELNEQQRDVFEAGITFASAMSFQMIAAAVESMKAAGLRSSHAESFVEAAVLGALRSYIKAGQKGWTGPLADADRDQIAQQFQALYKASPGLGDMFAKIAVDYLMDFKPPSAKPSKP
jgi:predicted short-subunit dehydrogenase-like oxidoreductase (DUF2520 family)